MESARLDMLNVLSSTPRSVCGRLVPDGATSVPYWASKVPVAGATSCPVATVAHVLPVYASKV